MRKENIDGINYYFFDEQETAKKKMFDKDMNIGDVLKSLMMALLDASYEAEIRKEEAWEEIKEQMKKEFPELPENFNMGYNRLLGRFDIQK
jgi:hypothetical protein